jgi:hypothetical protein
MCCDVSAVLHCYTMCYDVMCCAALYCTAYYIIMLCCDVSAVLHC